MKRIKSFFYILMIFCGLVLSAFTSKAESPQQIIVTGSVLDEGRIGLPGVSIQIKGTASGTVTNNDGRFSLSVPGEQTVLVFSFLGFQSQEITVGSRRDFTVVMLESIESIDEVVVVGYGIQKRASVTGAISSVQVDELKVSSSASIANALAGRISGLTSTQRAGGQPGRDDATMYLRGAATINGTSPLILIDGVPRDNIRTIDPNEVETISILKDASATSVFGVRGANGVIMITTKRGQVGKPELNINFTQTFSALTREPERVHSLEYLSYRNTALKNDGLESGMFSEEVIEKFRNPLAGLDPNAPDYEQQAAIRKFMYPDNDYYRMMMKRWSPQTVVNANLRGGTDKISYFMNVGFIHQGGQLKTEPKSTLGYDPASKLDRYSFRSNIDYKITESLTAFVNLGTYIEKVNMPGAGVLYERDQNWMMRDLFYQAQTVLPISPGPTTIAGFGVEPGIPLEPSYLNNGKYMDRSPYEVINYSGYLQETRTNLNSSLGLNWDLSFITKGLSAKGMISFDSYGKSIIYGDRTTLLMMAHVDPNNNELTFSEFRSTSSPLSLWKAVQTSYTINAQASINYSRKFEKHDIGGMVLAQRDYWEGVGADLPYNVLGVAGRVTYNYDLRYFAEVNLGYNGSEQFAPSKRFGFFPAASVGWAASEEEFLKGNQVLTYAKLRASIGRVGNDKMGTTRFLYQDNIEVSGGGYHSSIARGYTVNEGLLGNQNITWEMAEKINVGLDFQFIDAIKGSIDFFTENRSQILLTRKSVPVFQGVSLSNVPKVNMGEVENKGFEVELEYTKRLENLIFSVRGNFGYNQNKRLNVDEVPLGETYAYRTRETGYPIGQAWGYEIDWSQDGGYWTPETLTDDTEYGFGRPRVGDFVYKDKNDDGIVDEQDLVPIGCGSVPRITWGASVNVQYKGFDAYVFFQGLGKYYSNRSDQGVWETTVRGTFFPYHFKAWTEERWRNGDEITYPALSSTTGNTNHKANSFFIMNRSFVRLKNVEIGYTLPSNLLKSVGISQMRIFVSGQNIFTWSPKYRLTHLDPENDDTIGYPVTKMFNFGANITF